MNERNVKCSTFHIDIYDDVSWQDQCLVFSFIQRVAGRLKSARIIALSGLLDTLLPVIAAARCAFATFTLVARGEADDTTVSTPWVETLGRILANSSQVLSKLQIIESIDLQKHLEGVSLPALRDVRVIVKCDSDLISVCKAAPNITTLTTDDTCCTSAGLAAIGQHCRALETLIVLCNDNSSNVIDSDAGIAAMAQGCGKLKRITMEKCVNLSDIGLVAIAAHCTQLQSLSVWQCDRFTDVGLTAIQSLSATIVSLQLIECAGFTGSGLVVIAKHCTLLHTLDIDDFQASIEPDQLAEALPHMHNMTKLVLRCDGVDAEMLHMIADYMPLLQHLHLSVPNDDAEYTSDDVMHVVSKCEKLTYLELPAIVLRDVRRAEWWKAFPLLVVKGIDASCWT